MSVTEKPDDESLPGYVVLSAEAFREFMGAYGSGDSACTHDPRTCSATPDWPCLCPCHRLAGRRYGPLTIASVPFRARVCSECGVLVIHTDDHDRWHDEQGAKPGGQHRTRDERQAAAEGEGL